MIGRTLAIHFAGRFTKMVLAMFFINAGILTMIDFVDLFRRTVQDEGFHLSRLVVAVLLRAPSFSEETLPFAVLFGSIAAFVGANRRLEVVVARAAGVSAWQFLLPACIVGLLIGILGTTVYNPLSTTMRAWSDVYRATVVDNRAADDNGTAANPIWLRQTTGDGRESIIGADESDAGGTKLLGVTVYLFDKDGTFLQRVDAPEAQFADGEWRLQDATVTEANQRPQSVPLYTLTTTLSPAEVRQGFENLNTVSFWTLPALIEGAKKAGVPVAAYELRYDWLLARPILLLAMVMVAAIVSLRFSRAQDLGRMILSGVGMGFVLYVVTKVARDLGSGGILPPLVAAWLPASVAILIGATVLLHLEDG